MASTVVARRLRPYPRESESVSVGFAVHLRSQQEIAQAQALVALSMRHGRAFNHRVIIHVISRRRPTQPVTALRRMG